MKYLTRPQTRMAVLLLVAALSGLQVNGIVTSLVAADSTLTIQLVRAPTSTEPIQAAGTAQINLNTGQVNVQLTQATPNTVYEAAFLASSASATLQLGMLATGANGSGSVQANLSSGAYLGIFQLIRFGLVQYTSISTSFTIGATAPSGSSTSSQTATQTITQVATTQATTSANGTVQATVSVQPPSNTINAGAFAKFDIQIVDNSTADVYLVARGVPPDTVAIFTPNVGVANPSFHSSLTVVTSADTPSGNYAITAVAIINGKEFTNTISLQILAGATVTSIANATTTVSLSTTLAMTVSTDEAQYHPNATVNIQGQVTDSTGSAVADATVAIQVDSSTGVELFYSNSIHTDAAGLFQAQVNLTPTSPTGTYTVFSSASKPGYASTTTRTTFVVGTSTTPSVIIKAVYAGDSAGNPTSTFTAGQTIWVWVVIQNIGATFQGVVWIQVRDPSGVPVQIQIHIARLDAGETIKDGLGFTLLGHAAIGVYTVNALVSDKLISQGGTFLASAETQFALTG